MARVGCVLAVLCWAALAAAQVTPYSCSVQLNGFPCVQGPNETFCTFNTSPPSSASIQLTSDPHGTSVQYSYTRPSGTVVSGSFVAFSYYLVEFTSLFQVMLQDIRPTPNNLYQWPMVKLVDPNVVECATSRLCLGNGTCYGYPGSCNIPPNQLEVSFDLFRIPHSVTLGLGPEYVNIITVDMDVATHVSDLDSNWGVISVQWQEGPSMPGFFKDQLNVSCLQPFAPLPAPPDNFDTATAITLFILGVALLLGGIVAAVLHFRRQSPEQQSLLSAVPVRSPVEPNT